MKISERELAEYLYNTSMEQDNQTITRDDAMRMAEVMVSAAETTERVLADCRGGW